MHTMRALVVGDILQDTIAELDPNEADVTCRIDTHECEICLPYGSKIPIANQAQFAGGNAANVALGLTLLGVKTGLASAVGDDDAGRRLLTTLAHSGVDVTHVAQTKDVPTSSSFVVRYMGERTIFSYHAPHTIAIEPGSVDVVYLTSARTDMESIQKQLDRVTRKTLVFQPGTSQLRSGATKLAPLLREVDLLIVNESEAARLVKSSPAHQSPKQLLHALLDTKAKEVVITAGRRGAYISDGRAFLHCDIVQSAVRRDTTGVGDAFAAAYVWSRYVESGDMASAARAGSHNAANVLAQTGAQKGLLSAQMIREQMAKRELAITNL